MGRKSKASAEFFQPGASASDDAAGDMSIPEAAAAGTTGKAPPQTSCSLHRCWTSWLLAAHPGHQLSSSKRLVTAISGFECGSNAVCQALQGVLLQPRQLCR